MKIKQNQETRSIVRARLDAAVYALYLKLHDGNPRRIAIIKFIRAAGIGDELLDDLRQLGRVTSSGTGRGQQHAWTGTPPTAELIDAVENLREIRAQKKAAKLREKQAAKECTLAKQQPETAASLVSRAAELLPPDQAVDKLLEWRRRIDAELDRLTGQPRLPF